MRQKINIRLLFIALVAIVFTATGVTLVYYNTFGTKLREGLTGSDFHFADFCITALPAIAGIAVVMFLICVITGRLLTRNLLKSIEQMA
ncbi:MAG: hypothetical protein GX083_00585, partial [Clostridiales bacterium]|nr:hypothetical protein [Clostridiales bacterium]